MKVIWIFVSFDHGDAEKYGYKKVTDVAVILADFLNVRGIKEFVLIEKSSKYISMLYREAVFEGK
jgi:hypothetical protein